MGGNHSQHFDQQSFYNQWSRKQGASIDPRSVWKNKINPALEIEQYPIYADSQQDIDRTRQLFNLRKNSTDLVAATHLKQTVKGGLCSTSTQGRLFLEKIPLKLEALQHIPFPDVLHLYSNALNGYNKLYRVVGPFRPQSEQIGFNNATQAKVWLDGDFSSIFPVSKQKSQAVMVRNLLEILSDSTDEKTLPRENGSILSFIYRNKAEVTFNEALSSIREYAKLYNNGLIPKNLECINIVGIEKISNCLVSPSHEFENFHREQESIQSNLNSTSQKAINIVNPQIQQPNPVIISNSPSHLRSQSIQANGSNGSLFQSVRPQQLNQAMGPVHLQPVQPIQVVQPPIVQPVGLMQPAKVIQPKQVVAPVQFVKLVQTVNYAQGTSTFGERNPSFYPAQPVQPNIPKQKPLKIESQVQTVRPRQAVTIRSPQQQRVIQKIVRSPQKPVQKNTNFEPTQSPVIQFQKQASGVKQIIEEDYKQTNIIQSRIQEQGQNELLSEKIAAISQGFQQSQVQILNQLKSLKQQPATLKTPQQQTQFIQSRDQINLYGDSFVDKNRNFIESNKVSLGGDNQYLSIDNTPEKIKVEEQNLPKFESRSKLKDISLQDGKSSEALLAALRGFNSTKKEIPSYNFYDFSSSSQDFQLSKIKSTFQLLNQQAINSTFNNYARDSGVNEVERKYSLVRNLEEQPNFASYSLQPFQAPKTQNKYLDHEEEHLRDLDKYHQEGKYHVEYDSQIFADIQRLKA